MINLYTGTPGSGKSLDVARLILLKLRFGQTIIGTMVLNQELLKKYSGKYLYTDIYQLNPKDLVAYAKKYHKKGVEGQALIIIDECQRIFNSRDWGAPDRRAWNDFFQVHRHFGYDVILITQYDRLIDRQLRALIEYNYLHRKVSNFGIKGFLISLLFGGKVFITIQLWYPMGNTKNANCGSQFFVYRKKFSNLYDSYAAFDEDREDLQTSDLVRLLQSGDSVERGLGGPCVTELPEVTNGPIQVNGFKEKFLKFVLKKNLTVVPDDTVA